MRLIDLSTKSWVGQFPDFGLVSRLNIENAFLILRFDQNFVVFQGEILKTHLIFFQILLTFWFISRLNIEKRTSDCSELVQNLPHFKVEY